MSTFQFQFNFFYLGNNKRSIAFQIYTFYFTLCNGLIIIFLLFLSLLASTFLKPVEKKKHKDKKKKSKKIEK